MKQRVNYTLCLILLAGLSFSVSAQNKVVQKVKSHIEADPLTISGQVGGSLQMTYNNRDVYSSSSPFAATAYANFVIGVYGFSIPVNINLLNVSSTQFTFPRPQLSINTTPTYKNWRFHFGTSSMHFSNYTYSGLSFTGLGVEYQGKALRAATFYGIMQPATRFKELDNRSAIQYYADSLLGLNVQDAANPQYKRTAIGAKLGVGSTRNYLDLSFFKAIDDTGSLPYNWMYEGTDIAVYRDSVVKAKENLDVGLAGRISIGRWLTFNANMGMSIYSDDLTSTAINSKTLNDLGVADSADKQVQKVMDILDKVQWLYVPRLSSSVRFAGDAAMNLTFKHVSAMFTYRLAQADYTSLGANKFNQNAQGFGGNTNINLFKGRTFLSLSGYLQKDNLDGKQIYTNQVGTFAGSISSNLGQSFNIALSYNGIKQDQMDGTMTVVDSIRLDQLTHTVTLSPSYSIQGENTHTFSLNFNTVQNNNKNPLMKSSTDVSTYTAGLGYDVALTAKRMNVGANYDFSSSSAVGNSYTSHSLGGSFSYTITKTDKMNLRANYSMSISFNNNVDATEESGGGIVDPDEEPTSNKTNNISFSNRLGATFSYNKHHSAQCYLSMSNYSENIVIGQKIATSFDLRFNIAYNYSFAKRIIKSKKSKVEDEPILNS